MFPSLVGQPAPPFFAPVFDPAEPSHLDKTISLADFVGRYFLFLWYPSDFTTVCPTELLAFSDRKDEFDELDCALLGASTDSVHCHRAWADVPRAANGIAGMGFPLLADRGGQIARAWGVLLEQEGVALRGLFLVDDGGIVQAASLYNLNVGRSVDETLRVLQAVQSGGLCGSDWKPGGRTLTAR